MTGEIIAIVGAGIVGQSWAISFARAGFDVRLADVNPAALAAAQEAIGRALADLAGQGLLSGRPAEAVRRAIICCDRLEDAVAGAVHVQENAPENVETKAVLFARIDALTDPAATLASSTSALLPSAFTASLPGRARCMVAHPLNPPHLIPAVEIVPAPFTDPRAVVRCADLMARAGQQPITLTREVSGFVMNRLQGAILDEAVSMVAEGLVTVEEVDLALRDGLARRWVFMGPFETIDLNAPGGISGFIERYGTTYAEIGSNRPGRVAWTGDVAERLAAARRAILPLDDLSDRQLWRDRQLARLSAHLEKGRDSDGDAP
jgi:3-hydroxyacyl-CoA dehydrogenase